MKNTAADDTEKKPLLELPHSQDKNTGKNERDKSCGCYLVEVVIFIYAPLTYAFLPLTQLYIYSRISEDVGFNNSVTGDSSSNCNTNMSNVNIALQVKVQVKTSQWLMILTLPMSLVSMFTSLIIGPLTDQYGRKLGLLLPTGMLILKSALQLLVIGFRLPLSILVIGSILDGFCGSFGTLFMAAFSYIADITPAGNRRVFRIAVAEGITAITSGLSSLAFGHLIHALQFFYPMLLVTLLLVLCELIILFLIKESRVKKTAVAGTWKCRNLFDSFLIYCRKNPAGRQSKLILCLVCLLLGFSANIPRAIILNLFLLNKPFCWNSVKFGNFYLVQILFSWLVSMMLMKILQRFFSNISIAFMSSLSAIAFNTLLSFAETDAMMYIVIVIGSLSFLMVPVIRSTMSNLVEPSEQGAVFASGSSAEMLCTMIFVTAYTNLYSATLSVMPGAVFLCMAATFVICFFLLIVLWFLFRKFPESLFHTS